ncbi:5653_t:CDS:2, partial [Scutellospora calospora]
ISIQENIKDLPDELSDKYVVSFLSRNLAADEFLEDFYEAEDSVNINDICTELEQTVISEGSKKKSTRGKNQNKGEKDSLCSRKKATISAQLPKPPSFNTLVHNMPYHKGYVMLPKIYSGCRTLNHEKFRLQIAWDFIDNRENRAAYTWYRWEAKIGNIQINEKKPPQSQIWCAQCNVALCYNKSHSLYFKEYHTYIDKE